MGKNSRYHKIVRNKTLHSMSTAIFQSAMCYPRLGFQTIRFLNIQYDNRIITTDKKGPNVPISRIKFIIDYYTSYSFCRTMHTAPSNPYSKETIEYQFFYIFVCNTCSETFTPMSKKLCMRIYLNLRSKIYTFFLILYSPILSFTLYGLST